MNLNSMDLKVSINNITSNSVDITGENLFFTATFNNNRSECMTGLQMVEPYHSDEKLYTETSQKLIEISKCFLSLNDLLSEKQNVNK